MKNFKDQFSTPWKNVQRVIAILWVFMLTGIFNHLLAQGKTISGHVTDERGAPLPGVTVTLKGTTTGTITDMSGDYILSEVPDNAILVFSFIGMQTQEIATHSQTRIDVSLEPAVIGLDEVVAVGYGSLRKADVTGSVNRMVSNAFNPGPVTNPLQQLQGRMTGVNITQAGSDPNETPTIRIRGINSLAGGNDPLVVVDGVQGGPELLQMLSPSGIESFDILKDASSSAIYGSRGAAGVVIVTTKSGKAGKMRLEVNSISSLETVANKPDLMNASQWRNYIENNDVSASDYGANTNWFDEITRNGYILENNIAISGGSDKLNYRASLGYINHEGILLESGSDKLNGSLKVQQKNLQGRLQTTLHLNINTTQGDFVATDDYDDIYTALVAAYQRRPVEPVYNSDGSWFYDSSIWGYVNPVALLKASRNQGNMDSYWGSIKTEYNLLKELKLGVFASKRKHHNTYGYYQPSHLFGTNGYTYHGFAQKSQTSLHEKLLDLTINFEKKHNGHHLTFTGVYEWQQTTNEGFKAIGRDFISDINGYNNLGNGNIGDVQSGDISSFKDESTLISYLARINYSYRDKYLLTMNIRHDGSSKLGKNNKWGTFPSASVAWRISQEPFLKHSSLIDDLKLRVGYGETGNQGGLVPYQSLRLLASQGSTLFNGESVTLYATAQNENEDLKWEVKKMVNIGLDFHLLKNRLMGSIDYYDGTTDNMLYEYAVPVPPFYTNTLWANIGKMSNKGLEFSLEYRPVQTENTSWSIGFNLSKNENKIKSLNGTLNGNELSTDLVPYGYVDGRAVSFLKVGEPVGIFYVYKHAGVDEQGNEMLADLNKDGSVTIDHRSPDRYNAGNPQPDFIYGLNTTFRYKHFDAMLVFTGSQGNDIYNGTWSRLNRLGEIGILNMVPEAVENGIKVMSDFSDLWIQDGSFFRLSNLSLGYNIPVNNDAISRIRLSFTANNLFVITDYKGTDPEIQSDGSAGFGIDDFNLYPRSRSFALGLNLTLK
ncbi:SusC/RagA family TonB-linked outer membrane protein [Thermophagus sp. OGC60D27]|uniref:SusC/RagA family TonB-linked outer membrane protein n=1 Tax=Thermophagus sp. OGC60D27 TaxID=3458415 RepID=UPI00403838AC